MSFALCAMSLRNELQLFVGLREARGKKFTLALRREERVAIADRVSIPRLLRGSLVVERRRERKEINWGKLCRAQKLVNGRARDRGSRS